MCSVPSPKSPPVKIRASCFFDVSPRITPPWSKVQDCGCDAGTAPPNMTASRIANTGMTGFYKKDCVVGVCVIQFPNPGEGLHPVFISQRTGGGKSQK